MDAVARVGTAGAIAELRRLEHGPKARRYRRVKIHDDAALVTPGTATTISKNQS